MKLSNPLGTKQVNPCTTVVVHIRMAQYGKSMHRKHLDQNSVNKRFF
jgi:hypothetical protein